jgi:alkane 1-monooxygenase
MLKYLKHFLPAFSSILFLAILSMGEYYPTFFLIGFSLFIIVGDAILPRDKEIQQFSYPGILNLSIYINLPILVVLVMVITAIFSPDVSPWYGNSIDAYLYPDFNPLNHSFNTIDQCALIIQTSLFIGVLGTVPGHELTHRVNNTFDMLVGNWLLAFSCDCTFAIEHVYGHHKNACLPEDPASAKRGENIYLFIVNAVFREHIDGWKIELTRLRRVGHRPVGFFNRMLIGYLRSLFIAIGVFTISGGVGVLCFMICALVAKVFLEAINYVEHYGLVRERGKRVHMRHSWNSNHFMSSIYLYNVTRHSDHHRLAKLKFWELHPCPENAPMAPYGYLSMLYLVLLMPFLYKKIMAGKLLDWDLNYANMEEKQLAATL